MKPKGVENAEAVVGACRRALAALGPSRSDEWAKTLESVMQAMESLQGRFFLKTNPAIPATKACRRDAEEVERLVRGVEQAQAAAALERLKRSVEQTLKAAKMEGIIIT